MTEKERRIIEKMARAMCASNHTKSDPHPDFPYTTGWKAYENRAREQRAAHLAMIKAEQEEQ